MLPSQVTLQQVHVSRISQPFLWIPLFCRRSLSTLTCHLCHRSASAVTCHTSVIGHSLLLLVTCLLQVILCSYLSYLCPRSLSAFICHTSVMGYSLLLLVTSVTGHSLLLLVTLLSQVTLCSCLSHFCYRSHSALTCNTFVTGHSLLLLVALLSQVTFCSCHFSATGHSALTCHSSVTGHSLLLLLVTLLPVHSALTCHTSVTVLFCSYLSHFCQVTVCSYLLLFCHWSLSFVVCHFSVNDYRFLLSTSGAATDSDSCTASQHFAEVMGKRAQHKKRLSPNSDSSVNSRSERMPRHCLSPPLPHASSSAHASELNPCLEASVKDGMMPDGKELSAEELEPLMAKIKRYSAKSKHQSGSEATLKTQTVPRLGSQPVGGARPDSRTDRLLHAGGDSALTKSAFASLRSVGKAAGKLSSAPGKKFPSDLRVDVAENAESFQISEPSPSGSDSSSCMELQNFHQSSKQSRGVFPKFQHAESSSALLAEICGDAAPPSVQRPVPTAAAVSSGVGSVLPGPQTALSECQGQGHAPVQKHLAEVCGDVVPPSVKQAVPTAASVGSGVGSNLPGFQMALSQGQGQGHTQVQKLLPSVSPLLSSSSSTAGVNQSVKLPASGAGRGRGLRKLYSEDVIASAGQPSLPSEAPVQPQNFAPVQPQSTAPVQPHSIASVQTPNAVKSKPADTAISKRVEASTDPRNTPLGIRPMTLTDLDTGMDPEGFLPRSPTPKDRYTIIEEFHSKKIRSQNPRPDDNTTSDTDTSALPAGAGDSKNRRGSTSDSSLSSSRSIKKKVNFADTSSAVPHRLQGMSVEERRSGGRGTLLTNGLRSVKRSVSSILVSFI